ncbi:MAG: ABC transporter permease [Chlamydiales bacterium]|nr:ABC transporter permease [Chlamydiales bacterium]
MSQTSIITSKVAHKNYFREFLNSFDLLYFFGLRDIQVRYKQAFFGVAWGVIRPLLTMCVFVFIFSKMAHFKSGNVSYSLFVLLPMLFWLLFSGALMDSSNSLIVNSNMLTKIYFPRMILPCSSVVVHVADFLVGLVAFMVLACFTTDITQVVVGVFLIVPFFIVLCLLLCIGTGLWLSALTARYRDFRFIVPFTIQFGLFISPVGYSSTMVSPDWIWLYSLNPLVGIVEGVRWAVFGSDFAFLPQAIALSCVITAFLLVSGYYYFRSTEHDLADII